MNPDVDPQALIQQFESCEGFELRMNECLDRRSSLTSLEDDAHLVQCADCKTLLGVYRQVADCGAAVLNGGAQLNAGSATMRHGRFDRQKLWAKFSPVLVMAAAVVLFCVLSFQQEQPADESAFATPPMATQLTVVSDSTNQTEAVFDFRGGVLDFAGWRVDTSDDEGAWHNKALGEVMSAVSYSHQPTFDQLFEASEFSRRMLVQQLSQPVGGWGNPLQYTTELPGIWPLHRSVNVALVLYNDTGNLL